MKCVLCSKIVNTAISVYMERQGRQKKSAFRYVCEECYPKHMEEKGYELLKEVDGIQFWALKTTSCSQIAPTSPQSLEPIPSPA